MFQKGTGERFKYKQAVIEKFPDAICKKVFVTLRCTSYDVYANGRNIASSYKTAEDAWANAWLMYVKK